jgi:hypothetical protein
VPVRSKNVVVAAITGCAATVVAFFVAEIVLSNYAVCDAAGGRDLPTVAWIVSTLAYGGLVVAGFRHPARLVTAWLLAAIVGAVALVVLTLAFPAAHHGCAT